MKQTDPHFKMRLTPELKAKIAAAAKNAGRSMNAEIVHRLEASFVIEVQAPAENVDDALRQVAAVIVARDTVAPGKYRLTIDVDRVEHQAAPRGDAE